ncbi:unnamed protein product [Cuscuta campestris]|uniref:Uncharacterized protein n=1 Tax=Cuscuta campestris TaxID=132261 RepID=A0A484KDY8_9ASTE|nr:unnamed protein product [Cuscuta campestris]
MVRRNKHSSEIPNPNSSSSVECIGTTTRTEESSQSGRILTKWRASLKPENAEALITTHSWIFGYDIDEDERDKLEEGIELDFRRSTRDKHQIDMGNDFT